MGRVGFIQGAGICEIGREIGELGEGLKAIGGALLAGEAGEGEGFVAGAGDLVEELAEIGERLLDGSREGAFEALAEGIPVLLAFEDEVVHPAVAALEHLDELVFHLLPVVVAPKKKSFDGGAEGWVGAVDLLERLAGGAAIELFGLVVDAESVAEAGEERLLKGEVAAEGVDGGDAELGGLIEEVPAEGLGVSEGWRARVSMEKGSLGVAGSGGRAAFSSSVKMRWRISAAAALVKVMATIWAGSSTSVSRQRKRRVRRSVFPEPAGAWTRMELAGSRARSR